MVGFGSTKAFSQERLAKDDIRLLINCVDIAAQKLICDSNQQISYTRLELLIGKLKRMEKQ